MIRPREHGRLLFQKRFHAGLREGTIDLTFRRWSRPQVKVGGRYRLHPQGVLIVGAVDRIAIGDVPDEEARRAGFADADELADYLRRGTDARITRRTPVYRVAFRYEREGPAAPPPRPTAKEADRLIARLERMDRLSRHGPWTRTTLALIETHPRRAASTLAPHLGRELRSFKADVRKLKGLGLTTSFEVGYELTPLGRLVLKRL